MQNLFRGIAVWNIMFIFANGNVCHDDEITLGSGSFSGISQQLPKRW